MDPNDSFAELQSGIRDGVYNCIRLVKMNGNKKEILMPFNKDQSINLYGVLQVISKKLTIAPAGKYFIEAKQHFGQKDVHTDKFEIVKTGQKAFKNIEIQNEKAVEKVDTIQVPEIIQDNSVPMEVHLRALERIKDLENEIYKRDLKEEMEANFQALADKYEQKESIGEKLTNRLLENLEPLANGFLSYLNNRAAVPSVAAPLQDNKFAGMTPEQVVDYFDKLFDADEDRATKELMDLSKSAPMLYNRIVQELGLDEDPSQQNEAAQ